MLAYIRECDPSAELREAIIAELRRETTVDRTDFGVNWNVPLPDGNPALANEVKLEAELFFVKEA